MVIGVGLDMARVAFWARALERPEEASALARTFTESERQRADDNPGGAAERLASRFAAKEAFIKALGATRFGREPVVGALDLREIEVVSDAYGRPSLRLHGKARGAAEQLGVRHLWLSLTHEGEYSAALVVLEG